MRTPPLTRNLDRRPSPGRLLASHHAKRSTPIALTRHASRVGLSASGRVDNATLGANVSHWRRDVRSHIHNPRAPATSTPTEATPCAPSDKNPTFATPLFALCCSPRSSTAARAADIYDDAVAHAGRTPTISSAIRSSSRPRCCASPASSPACRSSIPRRRRLLQRARRATSSGRRATCCCSTTPPTTSSRNNAWQERIEKHHLANVEHRTVDIASMGLGERHIRRGR